MVFVFWHDRRLSEIYSNRWPDNCTFFPGRNLINERRNPPKNIAHNFYFTTAHMEKCSIWRELAPHYFPTDCFGGSSDLAGTGSILFSGGMFWRQLRFCGNWHHIIFQQIILEAAQIWRELAPHSLFSGVLFWRQLRFGGNWHHTIVFRGSSDLAGTGSTYNYSLFSTCKEMSWYFWETIMTVGL